MLTVSDYVKPNIFPEWVNDTAVSNLVRTFWNGERAIREKYRKYFTGEIFNERIPGDYDNPDEQPFMYPVGINMSKTICLGLSDAMFGEWNENIITFEPSQDEEVDQSDKDAVKLLHQILKASNANSLLWEVELDRNIYGGGVIKIFPSMTTNGHVRWQKIPLDSFFPIWNPDDEDDLLEVYIVTSMTKDQAFLQWGIKSGDDIVYRVEHWDKQQYSNMVDKIRIDQYSGINPWRIVPFVFIPRYRTDNWWGESLVEELINTQNELNMRIGDMGESIQYNSHPIKYGYNLPRDFNNRNFPVGPNVLWDLGKVIANSEKPFVGVLESKDAIPQGAFDYIEFLYKWAQITTFSYGIVSSADEGGSQRSGITLELRYMPLIRAMRRSRAYLISGLQRAVNISATILKQKKFGDINQDALDKIINGEITPVFANLLARDQAAIVDEIVKRLSTNPPTISLETAVKMLGQGTSEVDRIKEMLKEDDLFKEQLFKQESSVPGINGATGQAPNPDGDKTPKSPKSNKNQKLEKELQNEN